MPIEWWYSTGDVKKGPVSVEQLRQLLQEERIHRSTLVWREGMTSWQPLAEIEDLHFILAGLPPELPKPDARETLMARLPAGAWRRFFARCIDLWAISLPLGYLVSYILSSFSTSFGLWIQRPGAEYVFGWLIYPLVLVVEAGVFTIFGNTLGKSLLAVRVTDLDGHPISGKQYLRRQVGVYWYGLGTGFPLAPLLTMSVQWWRLKKNKSTGYDAGAFEVKASKLGAGRVAAAILVVLALLIAISVFQEMARSSRSAYYLGGPWTNPVTGQTVTLPAGWIHEKQTNEENQPYHMFSGPDKEIIVVFAKENLPSNSDLLDYVHLWRVAVSDNLRFEEREYYREMNGRKMVVLDGSMADDLSQKVQASLTLRGRQVWRIVVVGVPGKRIIPEDTAELRKALLESLN